MCDCPYLLSAQAEGSRSQNELPSFARMTATQSQRRLKSSPTGGVGSSPSGRRALSSAEAASAYPEPGPGEYLRRTAGVDLDKGARMGSKLVGSQAYLGFGYKSVSRGALSADKRAEWCEAAAPPPPKLAWPLAWSPDGREGHG